MLHKESTKEPSFLLALVPIVFLVTLLSINVIIFGDDALGGANQLALLFAAAMAAIVGGRLGFSWENIQNGIVSSIKSFALSCPCRPTILDGALAFTNSLRTLIKSL